MEFSLNEFLISVSNTLDVLETDIFGVSTNHSKRIAYISVCIGQLLRISLEEIFDLTALSLLHDNGATMKILDDQIRKSIKEKIKISESRKEHCVIGEDNLRNFPFLTNPQNIVLYHHETYDGKGFFGLKHDEIPLFAQIISLADHLDLSYEMNSANRNEIRDYVFNQRSLYFSPPIADLFLEVSKRADFWNDLRDESIDFALSNRVPHFSSELSYTKVRQITITFSRIIDAKSIFTQRHSSGLANRMKRFLKHVDLSRNVKHKLLIASDLHDLGKLAINNAILDKPDKLTSEEFNEIKRHPEISRKCLEGLRGFEDIAIWVGNHHEKLNGSGYPYGLTAYQLDYPSRLLVCMDIYQALRETRPYRKSMKHDKAVDIMLKMVSKGELDRQIVDDIVRICDHREKTVALNP